LNTSTSSTSPFLGQIQESDIPVAGDIVLLEADERYVGTAMWQEATEGLSMTFTVLQKKIPIGDPSGR
jgi:hypothetical protein